MNSTLHSLTFVTLSLSLTLACGKKSEDNNKDTKAKSEPVKASNMDQPKKGKAPDLSKWNQSEKEKAWQGSWLAKENGKIQAWTITGDAVQTWDGEEELSYTLGFTAPCRAAFKSDNGMSLPRVFAAVGGELRFGAGGYVDGAEALFCDGSGANYIVSADGKCSKWEDDFRKGWIKTDAECGIKKNADGVAVFFHGSPNSGEWIVEGDAIVPNSSSPTELVTGDFAAAKTARDAKVAQ